MLRFIYLSFFFITLAHPGAFCQVDVSLQSPCEKAQSFVEQANFSSAIEKYLDCINMLKKDSSELKDKIAAAYSMMGSCYYQVENFDASLEAYREAASLLEKLNLPEDLSVIYNNMGLIYNNMGKYRKAVTHLTKSLEIDKKTGNKESEAVTIYNIAMANYYDGDYEGSMTYFQELQTIYEQIGNPVYISFNLSNIAMVYSASASYEKAIDYYTRCLELSADQKSYQQSSLTHLNLAMIYEALYDFSRAAEHYKQSLVYERQYAGDVEVSLKLNNLGMFYYYHSQYDTAFIYLNESLNVALKTDDLEMVSIVQNNIGLVYDKQGMYAKAIEQYTKAIELDKTNHFESLLATHINNLGLVYKNLGEYSLALDHFTQALETDKNLGNEDKLAVRYNNIGLMYSAHSEFDKAQEYYLKAYDFGVKYKQADIISTVLNNIGLGYVQMSNYNAALNYFSSALQYDSLLNKENRIANNLNCIGMVYANWGEFDRALDYYEKALEIDERLGLESDVSVVLSNIGSVYQNWGKNRKAMDYFFRSVEIDESTGNRDNLSKKLHNLGIIYYELGDYVSAMEFYEKALLLDEILDKKAEIANYYNSMGMVYLVSGDEAKGEAFIHKSIDMYKKLGLEGYMAAPYLNIALIYLQAGNYKKAIDYGNRSLEISILSGDQSAIASCYSFIGQANLYLETYVAATEAYKKSIRIYEKLRKTAPLQYRKDYMDEVFSNYGYLTLSNFLDGNTEEVFQSMEAGKSKSMLESMSSGEVDSVGLTTSNVVNRLEEDECIIMFASVNSSYIPMLVFTNQGVSSYLLNKNYLISEVIGKLENELRGQIERDYSEKDLENFNTYVADDSIVLHGVESFDHLLFCAVSNYYRKLLMLPYSRKRDQMELLSKCFYALFINPAAKELADKKRITIVTDGILGILPFETFMDSTGKYSVERFDFSYVNSMSVLDKLKERDYSSDRKSMLAFGGAIYNPETYSEDMSSTASIVYKEGTEDSLIVSRGLSLNQFQVDYVLQSIEKSLNSEEPLNDEYKIIGMDSWINLGGSLAEVDAFRTIVPDAQLLKGKDVNEGNVKKLSSAGELKKFKVLHFSAHGLAIPDIPILSALVLSKETDSTEIEDGFLRMDEIAQLQIEADFVNLSACETGLGKIYAGEGVVGLSQSFLVAGANSTAVSLWQVADQATAEFMVRLYQLHEKDGLTYIESMNRVKREFIHGDFEKEWQHPFFWAPFVYYGR